MGGNLRLKRNCDFDKVFKEGKKVFGKTLILLYKKEKTLKVGFCVSKKHGKAVLRNRIKRLLRASFQEVLPLINGGYHIVVLPKVSANYSFDLFKEDFKKIAEKEFNAK